MMSNSDIPEFYFKSDTDWYNWLLNNYDSYSAIYLVFYKLETKLPTMRWEEAVKVALCFGWIDSTVKSLGDGKRIQYFSPRKPKSVWSAVNKAYIKELKTKGLMQPSGLKAIEIAKENGSWSALDDVENGIIPKDLQLAFNNNPKAFSNYQNFSKGYKKSYLYWLNTAKLKTTRQKRIAEIVKLCEADIKSRS